jgi:hypothetical protein
METIKVCLGTEVKLNINNEPMGKQTMDDYDWQIEAYIPRGRGKVTIRKEQAIRVDADNYMVVIDTAAVGVGDMYIKQTAIIPDADLADKKRTEVDVQFSGLTIVTAK